MFHNNNKRTVISNGGEGVHPRESVWVDAEPGDLFAGARFTAAARGQYELNVSSEKVLVTVGNQVDVQVLLNGVEVFSGIMNPGDRPTVFAEWLNLRAGECFVEGTPFC